MRGGHTRRHSRRHGIGWHTPAELDGARPNTAYACPILSIANGTRMGPYELIAPLGAGGMGEVWRATDTRLGRSVAVKILPPELRANAQLRLRFEREAKVISQLNHPNICSLFDVGEHYLVMELLDGETLADRTARGPLPLIDVLQYGAQIADALDRAHRAGIVHRDLKPGNVMITKSGAKLLDFGLAKPSPLNATIDAATEQRPLTQEGTILGTFQYMAPEQLEGLEADARTDIFALGALLYEMATGRRAFDGKSKTSLIAAIVSAEPPPISNVQPLTPAAFEHVVRKCLAKDPDSRWQSAYDVAENLRWIAQAGSASTVTPLLRTRSGREVAAWTVAALAVIAGGAAYRWHPRPAADRVTSAILPPEGTTFSYVETPIAISDDGRQLAFIARTGNAQPTLWIRPLSSSTAHEVAGTEGAHAIFWSPDGKHVGFASNRKLQKVDIGGGAPEAIADVNGVSSGAWLPDGTILYASVEGIQRVSSGGGRTSFVMRNEHRSVRSPVPLPDGRHFLFTASRGTDNAGVYVRSLDRDDEKIVLSGVYSNAAYVSPGFLLFSRAGDLRAQKFDMKTLKVSGDEVRLADHVQYNADAAASVFTVSNSGLLVYAEGEGAGKTQLTWVSRDGKPGATLAAPALFYSPSLSHDGTKVAVDWSDAQTATGDIWTFDLVKGSATRLTYDPANESGPLWSSDDRHIIYHSEKSSPGIANFYQKQSNGSGGEELLFANNSPKATLDVSPDGRWVAFATSARSATGMSQDIYVLDLSKHVAAPLIATPFNEGGLSFSPDGHWIAFTSNESGREEVYVQRFPDSTGTTLVSRNGGLSPRWRGDGRELYYLSPDRRMMAVPVTFSPEFDSGTPVTLFDAHVREMAGFLAPQYAVSRDGSKFLLNVSVGGEATRPMTLVQNWMSLIAR